MVVNKEWDLRQLLYSQIYFMVKLCKLVSYFGPGNANDNFFLERMLTGSGERNDITLL